MSITNNRKHRPELPVILILSCVLIFCLFCLWRSYRLIEQMEAAEPIAYTERKDGKVVATLPSVESLTFSFGKNRVCVENCSAAPSKTHAINVALFIKGYAEQNEIECPRSLIMLIGEYRLHAVLTTMGYKSYRTNDADIDYIQDSRWYVEVVSAVFGCVGI